VGLLYGESIDIDSPFGARLTDDQAILTQAILMRLSTQRGLYWADPEYGLLLSGYVNEGLTPDALARIPQEVQSELEKDERVASASVTAAVTNGPQGVSMTLGIKVTPVQGQDFAFVVAASAVTVDLITRGSV
jgi:phage baseplate assembly protein W